ncbi:perlucin-like [Gigantopelta aegis]|uniref:perlucin-like n=1 Tax=Gigantopelta aegis TaxID=1735272 RepID=UPI001B8876A1|nr:perlucin-like [Gigantopelta aegis]
MDSYLVVITSAQEDKFIREHLLRKATSDQYWIGANDVLAEGHFRWMSKTPPEDVTYINWYSGEPNNDGGKGNCVVLGTVQGFFWNDIVCTIDAGFICEQN